MPIKDKYNELVTTLKRYNDAYYNTDAPLVTDAEYDMLYKQLVSIENEYPHLLRNDSPTQYVGSKIAQNTGFKKAKHKRKMLSLANVFSTDELKKWLEELNALPSGPYAFIAEPKYDGLSIELVYKHGKLVDAITRGDGWIGESVIKNVLTITNIPKVCNMPKHSAYLGSSSVFMASVIAILVAFVSLTLPLLTKALRYLSYSFRPKR